MIPAAARAHRRRPALDAIGRRRWERDLSCRGDRDNRPPAARHPHALDDLCPWRAGERAGNHSVRVVLSPSSIKLEILVARRHPPTSKSTICSRLSGAGSYQFAASQFHIGISVPGEKCCSCGVVDLRKAASAGDRKSRAQKILIEIVKASRRDVAVAQMKCQRAKRSNHQQL
jgi:hypothetical protein